MCKVHKRRGQADFDWHEQPEQAKAGVGHTTLPWQEQQEQYEDGLRPKGPAGVDINLDLTIDPVSGGVVVGPELGGVVVETPVDIDLTTKESAIED